MNQKLGPMCNFARSATTPGTPTEDALLHIMLATHLQETFWSGDEHGCGPKLWSEQDPNFKSMREVISYAPSKRYGGQDVHKVTFMRSKSTRDGTTPIGTTHKHG
jgi:hypothetical protein